MNKYFIALVGLVMLTSCQNETKIGFVDNVKLINEYQEKIEVEASLKEKIAQYEKRRDSLGQAFQLEAQEAEVKSKNMSSAELQKLQQEFQQKQQIISQRLQFEQNQISQESRTLNDTLKNKVVRFVEDYGKKNGYTYILGSNEGGSVMYGDVENDLTQIILDKLNEGYKKK